MRIAGVILNKGRHGATGDKAAAGDRGLLRHADPRASSAATPRPPWRNGTSASPRRPNAAGSTRSSRISPMSSARASISIACWRPPMISPVAGARATAGGGASRSHHRHRARRRLRLLLCRRSRALERAGARLVFFDALKDARLPDCDGLFIGGGFPETQAEALVANASLRADIARALAAGLPAYAGMRRSRCISPVRSPGAGGRSTWWAPCRATSSCTSGRRAGARGRRGDAADAPWPADAGADRRARIPLRLARKCRSAGALRLDRCGAATASTARATASSSAIWLRSFTHFRDTSRNRWAQRFVGLRARAAPGLARAA